MLRASDIGDHSPHAVGNANDPAVRRIRWLNDSFPDLLFPDRVWGEAIKASRLWEEWALGADPYLPRGLIESFLRVFKHFALKIPRGKVWVFF